MGWWACKGKMGWRRRGRGQDETEEEEEERGGGGREGRKGEAFSVKISVLL